VIWLRTVTVFWLGGETISLSSSVSVGLVNLGRQMYIHTAESLMSEPSASDFEMAIKNVNRHTSPSIYQIPTELIKAGSKTDP
jgi:hypothetical protein